MDLKKYEENIEIFKGLSHPIRLCIVTELIKNKNRCNVTFMQKCIETSQSNISQHLAKLRNLGIVEYEKKGLEVYYYVSNPTVIKLIKSTLK